MAKCVVNGEAEEPLWTYLKNAIPAPADDHAGMGADFIYDIQPNDKPIQWSPVRRSDIAWNFEKFLINADGKIIARFNSGVEPTSAEVTEKIEKLVK